ncbi:hypothetical protein DACRYDRAFT_104044 [Dacryopinax primogenitus]|uniref:Uncharacterized protein n=1 Tax=Dacryopinax primogenitus (strain DJM 731) TaxID=1858805 RepID=M5GGI7_DACPD|nr:uncharacterized protein DACRYDRAFT_104044 [Dacryopinax primogenitus]EJU05558.1 hypothetical protein DACRYDRAFT_104044 [Dacryopinax primogenitus]
MPHERQHTTLPAIAYQHDEIGHGCYHPRPAEQEEEDKEDEEDEAQEEEDKAQDEAQDEAQDKAQDEQVQLQVQFPDDGEMLLVGARPAKGKEKRKEKGSKAAAKPKYKGLHFGRCRTHNKQLVVHPCSVILAWATFYGSEGMSSVAPFLMSVFPTCKAMPEVLFFDNNCTLGQYLVG